MKTPLLSIPEYRKRFALLIEENMKLQRRCDSLQHSLDDENKLRGECIDENIRLRKKFDALTNLLAPRE